MQTKSQTTRKRTQTVDEVRTQPRRDTSLLSPQLAFVVQFRSGTGRRPESFRGRVEHLPSGRAAHFYSLEELASFFVQVLDEHHPEVEQGP